MDNFWLCLDGGFKPIEIILLSVLCCPGPFSVFSFVFSKIYSVEISLFYLLAFTFTHTLSIAPFEDIKFS